MHVLMGLLFAAFASIFVIHARRFATANQQSNQTVLGRSGGRRTWLFNVVIVRLVGSVLVVGGLAYAVGIGR
ncbi:hypothetical protein OG875_18610 [Streptomyces sp. NBC_01498]|uniref:hypothetical protein n=1 Tax=Streptomyces sp. NBC_01498 TaxID=2975870 RepID=UPI002E7B86D0|nr:hypothetical protein [Streptomyces sp. NBC_01498]WTL26419.1 hypothetical protein OG875_18610 [Streptomyces sp. NBC_01498]